MRKALGSPRDPRSAALLIALAMLTVPALTVALPQSAVAATREISHCIDSLDEALTQWVGQFSFRCDPSVAGPARTSAE
jgi:hypothetical protein